MAPHQSPPSPSPGLAPLSDPADSLDLLAHLPDDVKALVINPCLDMITQGAAKGQSPYVLMCLRGMLRRVVRGEYDLMVRRGTSGIDVDTTGWG
jgi:hypothetical protein